MGRQIVKADASELVQGLLSPAPSEAFSIFRPQADGSTKEFPVRVRLLRIEEEIAALAAAQAYAKKVGESSGEHSEIYREAQAYEQVARCLCHPDEQERQDGTRFYRQLFVHAGQLRESFTRNEVAAVLNCYEVLKWRYSCVRSFEPEHLEEWAAKLSDTVLGPYFLAQLDSDHWPELLTSLAQELCALRERIGQPLPSWRATSESDRETSESGTSGSISSATAQSSDGVPVPSAEPLITRDQARALAKQMRDKKK